MTILFIITIILGVWVLVLHVMLCKERARHKEAQRDIRKLRDEIIDLSYDRYTIILRIEAMSDHYGDIDIHQELNQVLKDLGSE